MTAPGDESRLRSGRLDIEIEQTGTDGLHTVRIDRDGALASTTFKSPFGKDGLVRAAERLDRGLVTEVTTKSVGKELFDALFSDPTARSIYDESRGEKRTRLRFIAGDGEAASIPWELLYDSKREQYLSQSGAISRWMRVSADISVPPRTTLVDGPLRTLVVLADPLGNDLDLDAEARAIQEAFAIAVKHDRAEEVELLPQATLSRLQLAVTEAANSDRPFHIIHFAGHTGQDPGNPLPFLRLDADEHHDGKVDPETFAEVVAGSDGGGDVRMVFLNACGTLQAGESRSGRLFPGFAGELVRRGVPAVVGTQSPVLDSYATRIAREFYQSLIQGNRVDEALTQVRELIHGDGSGQFSNFGIPVCYLSGGDGRLVAGPKGTISRWRERLTPREIVAMVLFLLFTLIPGALWYIDRFVPDPPPRMVGDFNVGVAEFDPLPPRSADEEDLALDLSGSLFSRLNEEAVLNCGGTSGEPGTGGRPFDCQGPTTVQVLEGSSEEKQEAAAEYAERTNAHLVVYGALELSDGIVTLAPVIYLSDTGLRRAEELTGAHALSIREGPVASTTQRRQFRGEVEQMALDLGELSIALSYYTDPDYPAALESIDGLIDRGTFELDPSLLNLIAGNLQTKLAGDTDDADERSEFIDAAEASYQSSIDATAGYARGWLGLGEVSYQRGRQDGGCQPDTVDETQLDISIARYLQAREEPESPEAANVELKSAFGVGRTLTCLATAGAGDHWSAARESLTAVVDGYEAGARGIDEFASESYSLIAFIDLTTATTDEDIQRALEQSAEFNELAIEASSDPDRIGFFYYRIADAYLQLDQTEQACDNLSDALAREDPAAIANAGMFGCG